MDIDKCLAELREVKCISQRNLQTLCQLIKQLLLQESNVQPVYTPVNICGDIHGQFYDFLELFRTGGEIPESNYIFIGDFVDRGYHSVETLQYMMCLKVKYPKNITLLRGNHETRQVTQVYGFYEEILRKYGNTNPWKLCTEVFDYLPIGAIVDGRILCIHGGLSPQIKTIDQIRTIDRKMEIPHQGPFCDLMWSDPDDIEDWGINARGAGWIFGGKVTRQFNQLNGLQLVARAHQLVQQGYQYWFKQQSLVTVWSVPNYCYKCNNDAAILCLDENLNRNFKTFRTVPESQRSMTYRSVTPYFL